MYTITFYTFNNIQKDISVIDRELVLSYFSALTQAVDCAEIIITDGLTGEIIYSWVRKDKPATVDMVII